jgi:hypothetical protein
MGTIPGEFLTVEERAGIVRAQQVNVRGEAIVTIGRGVRAAFRRCVIEMSPVARTQRPS